MEHVSDNRPQGVGKTARYLGVEKLDAKRFLLPGDPDRVTRICKFLGDVKIKDRRREFLIAEGWYGGQLVGVCSTGIGCPSVAIVVEELANLGATHMIRVGTTGALSEQIKIGDLCVATAAIRNDGTTPRYVPPAIPALPDWRLTVELYERAATRPSRAWAVPCVTNDALYTETPEWAAEMARYGVMNVEMEAAALFVVGQLRHVRTASICAVLDNLVTDDHDHEAGIDDASLVALETLQAQNV